MLAAAPLAAETGHYVAADGSLSALWVLIALPLLGSAILLLGGRRTDKWGPLLGCATTGAAFVYGLIAFFDLRGRGEQCLCLALFSWIPGNGLHGDSGLLFDPLSATFVLLITGVGFLIHV